MKNATRGVVMIIQKQIFKYIYTDKELDLQEVDLKHPTFNSLFKTHYPRSRGIVGRKINYLIWYKGELAGIIGFSSPPFVKYALEYFFQNPTIHDTRYILNNNVFRLIINEKNLGSRVLSLARKTVIERYKEKYGDNLKGFITFVEPPRKGIVYKADNWDFIGYTKGLKANRKNGKFISGRPSKDNIVKLIFGRRVK